MLLCSPVPPLLRSFVPSVQLLIPFLRSFVPLFLRYFVPSFLRFSVPSFRVHFAVGTLLKHRAGPLGSRSPEETGTVHDRAVDVRVLLRVLQPVAAVLHHLDLLLSVPLHGRLEDIP